VAVAEARKRAAVVEADNKALRETLDRAMAQIDALVNAVNVRDAYITELETALRLADHPKPPPLVADNDVGDTDATALSALSYAADNDAAADTDDIESTTSSQFQHLVLEAELYSALGNMLETAKDIADAGSPRANDNGDNDDDNHDDDDDDDDDDPETPLSLAPPQVPPIFSLRSFSSLVLSTITFVSGLAETAAAPGVGDTPLAHPVRLALRKGLAALRALVEAIPLDDDSESRLASTPQLVAALDALGTQANRMVAAVETVTSALAACSGHGIEHLGTFAEPLHHAAEALTNIVARAERSRTSIAGACDVAQSAVYALAHTAQQVTQAVVAAAPRTPES